MFASAKLRLAATTVAALLSVLIVPAPVQASLAATVTITYEANGATAGSAPSAESATVGSEYVVALNTGVLTRTGYRFLGWNTVESGTGTTYVPGIDSITVATDLTLYALWETRTGFGIYLDAPFVQNSYVYSASDTSTALESFNSFSNGASCATTLAVGAMSGDCRVDPVSVFGGASTISASPTVGGTGTNYPTTAQPTTRMTLDLGTPRRYMGLWWSAGSASNQLQFYNGNVLLGTMTTNRITTLLSAVGAWPHGNVTTMGNNTYPVGWYYGNPRGYSSTSPTGPSTITSGEPFVYIHAMAQGGLSFDRVVISGGGFEFDNLVVGTAEQTPPSTLVLSEFIATNRTVTFEANSGSGSMASQTRATAGGLTSNSFSRTGHFFAGWNTRADGTGRSLANGATYSFDRDITLYAQWTRQTYTLGYNANTAQAGSAPTSVSVLFGDTATAASAGNLTKPGWDFAGWNTAANGSGTSYGAGDSFAMPANNVTLFAQWVAQQYAITYDANGGVSSAVPVDTATYVLSDSATVLSAPAGFVRPGYEFLGWNTSADGSGTALSSGDTFTVSSSVTLFAQWRELPPVDPLLPSVVPTLSLSGSTLTCSWGTFSSPVETVNVTLLVGDLRHGITRVASPTSTTTWVFNEAWRGVAMSCEVVARAGNRMATATSLSLTVPVAINPSPTPTPTTPVIPARGSARVAVYFDVLSPELDARDRRTLARLVQRAGTEATYVVTGFVQPTVVRSNDRSLSLARARNTTAELRRLGVPATNITFRGVGRAQETGATARRTEVVATWSR